MKRGLIRVIAGVLGMTVVLMGAACGKRSQPAATGTESTPTTSPSPTTTPSPITSPANRPPSLRTWDRLPGAPIEAPSIQASVWTGTEMLLFGRVFGKGGGSDFDVAAAYNPATDTWRELPAGINREGGFEGGYKAVWTGQEMLVWGISNKAFNPTTNTWRQLSEPPAYWGGPAVAVWTGSQMIGWGGGCCGDSVDTGMAYTPATDSWEVLPPSPLAGRQSTSGAWTGTELIVLGGNDADGKIFAGAAAYNPATRTWRRLPSLPEPRSQATTVWDGAEVLVVGGNKAWGTVSADGVAYRPSTNSWRRLPSMEFPRQGHVAVWTGSQLLVWGGMTGETSAPRPEHGESYDPLTNGWSPLPKSVLRGRTSPSAVWTGTMMIIWGGGSVGDDPAAFTDGASYTPGAS